MTSFIQDVLLDLNNKAVDLSQLTFILPSKRAGTFLKHEISNSITQTIFSPEILSIEEFVEELSQLKQLSNTELLFEFYQVYLEHAASKDKDKLDSFDNFSKWAQTLLQDFNEIDRFLIPSKHIFDYLSAIQDINHWSLQKNRTPLIENYLSFWENLNSYYTNLSNNLINKGLGYQGLIYREAVDNLETYIQTNSSRQHLFVGFNALNTAESSIIQELLQNDIADIYWDIDNTFVNNQNHDAGLFIRHHKKTWNYFKKYPFKWLHDNYTQGKNISVVGVPKNVGQAKYIGELLFNLKANNTTLNSTAIVLGDENLLIPVLNSLPKDLGPLNITMGFPLKSIPLAYLFNQFFLLHKDNASSFYYKDIAAIVSHQFIRPLFKDGEIDLSEKLLAHIHVNNLVLLSDKTLISILPEKKALIKLLFGNWENNPYKALQNSLTLILEIKSYLTKDKDENLLALEYLFHFNAVFNVLNELNAQYKFINTIKVLHSLYNEILSTESLDFQGEPLQGLQIMGMLETRVLDFETVIISSVNEGILPSGKSMNSFIPFDIKLENGLPTYKEKDAVYTYHFYRLVQRAKNVYIIHNTESDILNGGEKSRFITQLEIEGIHNLTQTIVTPKTPRIPKMLNGVPKTKAVIAKIYETAQKGLSPSSLTNYIRNPMDFYYQKILGIKEYNEVEETVALNTLGSVVHNTLEDFYTPLENKMLTIDAINAMKLQIDNRVTYHFKSIYKDGDITKGKNLIIFEISKRYVTNFLNKEFEILKQGHTIKIIEIEADLNIDFEIEELNIPVRLTGKVDRVDEYDGQTRIIDYKTGRVEQNKVEIVNWEDITTDYTKYSKSFQVLMYAYMMNRKIAFKNPIEAGIISFKNLNAGFLKFAKKEALSSRKKDTLITQKTLNNFEIELKKLILDISNPEIDFIEKEV